MKAAGAIMIRHGAMVTILALMACDPVTQGGTGAGGSAGPDPDASVMDPSEVEAQLAEAEPVQPVPTISQPDDFAGAEAGSDLNIYGDSVE